MASAPAPPLSTLAAALPERVLPRLLPVPLTAAVPMRVSFSMLAPSVQLTLLSTVSISVTTVEASTTTSDSESTV